MHLYHLTLQPPTAITHVLSGAFTGTPKQQEVLVVRGDRFLELLRFDATRGRLEPVGANGAHPVFGTIRAVSSLRIPGDLHRDYLVVGSDSGATVILAAHISADDGNCRWERVAGIVHGRSGARRSIPGQMIAVDPRGRALLTAALDTRKFAHTVTRTDTLLALSSPLEAHRPGHLCLALVALDAGLEHHPAFATLEVDIGELDEQQLAHPGGPLSHVPVEKHLVYYELDQGLNQLVRKWSEVVDVAAGGLIAVPGGTDGPGGVLVTSPGRISHHRPGQPPVHLLLPTVEAAATTPLLISAHTLVKTKSVFFFFLQLENGDLFRLSLDTTTPSAVILSLRYFDTLPVATAIAVLRSGHLFLATQSGPAHQLLQITGLGDAPDEPEFLSSSTEIAVYRRHDTLHNLAAVDELVHFGPVTGGRIMNLGGEETPQFYLTHGQDAASSVSVTRWGLPLIEHLALELPPGAHKVWRIVVPGADQPVLLVSFVSESILLEVDMNAATGSQMEATASLPLALQHATIAAGHLDPAAFVQIHAAGLVLVRWSATGDGQVSNVREWSPGRGRRIQAVAFNARQLCIALDSHELVRLQYDPATGGLSELETAAPVEALPMAIDHLAVAPLQTGRRTSRFIAIGTTEDQAVRILDGDSPTLEVAAIQALTAAPSALLLTRDAAGLLLHIGLDGGILIRFQVDETTGALLAPTSRFVGGARVALTALPEGVLALGARPWLETNNRASRLLTAPLFYTELTAADDASTPDSSLAFVALAPTPDATASTLRILAVQPDALRNPFHRQTFSLGGMTPRRIAFHPPSGLFVMALASPVAPGQWTSSIALFDPTRGQIGTAAMYHDNEAALLAAFVVFHDRDRELFLAVAGGRAPRMAPRSAECSFIDLFPVLLVAGEEPRLGPLVHRTPVDVPPTALAAFNGRLLAAVGCDLRMYDLGRSRLLRKTQCRLASAPVSISSQGLRIYVGTVRDAHTLLIYRPDSNTLVPVADDPVPRGITADCILDYDTIAGGDRFGTVFVDRLPAAVSESLDSDRFLSAGTEAREFLLAAPEKLERLVEFYLGDTVTVLEHMSWTGDAGREALWYVTVSGAIGCFLPFPTKSLAAAAQAIELQLRQPTTPANPNHASIAKYVDLLMRSHVAYRSAFTPTKAVIDGDLVASLLVLPANEQHAIATALDKPLSDLQRRIAEWRRLTGI